LALGGQRGFVENPGPGPGRLGLLPGQVVAVCPPDRCIVACNDATIATTALQVGVCPCLSQDRCIVATVAVVARQSRCSAMQPPRGRCNDATTTNGSGSLGVAAGFSTKPSRLLLRCRVPAGCGGAALRVGEDAPQEPRRPLLPLGGTGSFNGTATRNGASRGSGPPRAGQGL
jgi:hypothetical protein